MPTNTTNIPMTGAWVLAGTGPETVLISARGRATEYQHASAGVVYWLGPTASPPAGVAFGHPVTGGETKTFTLAAGESLWLNGTTDFTAIVTETDIGGQNTASPLDKYGNGTRELGPKTRLSVTTTSARVALPTLGPSRVVYVMPNTRCFFLTGDGNVTAAAGTSDPLAIDERFFFNVPAGHTHIAFIADQIAGNVTICAVV